MVQNYDVPNSSEEAMHLVPNKCFMLFHSLDQYRNITQKPFQIIAIAKEKNK